MKQATILMTIVFCVTACIKEKITNHTAFLKNNTNHEIFIVGYTGGVILQNDSLRLRANEKIKFGEGFMRGIVNNAGFFLNRFGAADSLHVWFNGRYKVTHYLRTPAITAAKHLLYDSKRNILNKDSYRYEYKDDSKYQRTATYTYEFTEDDYRFAQ